MKKIVTMLLVLVMVACVSVSAFAEDYDKEDSVTLTAVVPGPSYTIVIPKDTTLTYGETGEQNIGIVAVKDVTGVRIDQNIWCKFIGTDLTNTEDETVKLETVYYLYSKDKDGTERESSFNDYIYSTRYNNIESVIYSGKEEYAWDFTLTAKVGDWSKAIPGIYESTVKFKFSIIDYEGE